MLLPSQVLSDDELTMNGISKVFQTTITAMISSNLILNVIISNSLGELWNMVNALQLIAYLPLFSIEMPANV